jgi:hypothetical protein
MDQKTLTALVESSAIKRARIVAHGENFHVEVDSPGRSFTIETSKGGLRTWRSIDATAKWLRSVGIAEATLNVAKWSPGQKSLPLTS